MKLIEDNDFNNVEIIFKETFGMGGFCNFEYIISLRSNYDKYYLSIYPNDKFHKHIEYFDNNKQIEIDSNYFRNILEKINEIDFYTFSKIGKLWDAGEVIFEFLKSNLNIKVFYSGIMLRDHRSFKFNKNIDNLNKIFEELQIKIGKKEWYNNILEKYSIRKI